MNTKTSFNEHFDAYRASLTSIRVVSRQNIQILKNFGVPPPPTAKKFAVPPQYPPSKNAENFTPLPISGGGGVNLYPHQIFLKGNPVMKRVRSLYNQE